MMSTPDSIIVWHCNKKCFQDIQSYFYISLLNVGLASFASCVLSFFTALHVFKQSVYITATSKCYESLVSFIS